MHQLPIEQQVLLISEIVALAFLCTRLWVAGLYRVYGYFFGYLILQLLQELIPVVLPLNSSLYRVSYVVSEALLTAFYALVVLDLYSKILGDLVGIATIARRYIKITLFAAILISLALLRLGKPATALTGYLFTFERTVMASLVVFVLFVTAFLVYYPVPLGRNVVVYLIGYAVYFLAHATIGLVMNSGYHNRWNRELSGVGMTVSLCCSVFWFIALSRQGENKRVLVGHQWNSADQQRLRAQLDAINVSLLRAGGKIAGE